jgi:hypothetical protein
LLPNFICPGAQKSATTALYEILRQHPDIFLPKKKEPGFFFNNDYIKGIDWYEREYFFNIKNEKIVGDLTPNYIYYDYVAKRICYCLGKEVKFIFMLRNPIDRAYSNYWMSYKRGYEKETFERAIELEKARIKMGDFEKDNFSYVERGFYSKQIKNYLYYFPKENMKFIIFEDFIKNIPGIMEQIFLFLKVDPNISIDYNTKSNPAKISRSIILRDLIKKPPKLVRKTVKFLMPNRKMRQKSIKTIESINYRKFEKPELKLATKYELLDIYKKDIKELESLIDKKLTSWFEIK